MSPLSKLGICAAIVGLSGSVLGYTIYDSTVDVRAPDIEQGAAALKSRVTMKQTIASDLGKGRLTLLEAAAEVYALDLPAAFWSLLPLAEVGRTNEERICRHIIAIAVDLIADPEEAEIIKLKLEKELEAVMDSEGVINIPPRRRPFMLSVESTVD